MKYRFFLGKWSLIPRRERGDKHVLSKHVLLYRKKPHTSYLACSAWDLRDQKDKADLERVQAMCMVFNYSVDSTDFRHKNSVLLLLEKYKSL